MSMPTVGELVRRTAERLAAPELVSQDPQMEARELIAHALGVAPRDLPRKHDDVLDSRTHDAFLGLDANPGLIVSRGPFGDGWEVGLSWSF